MLNAGIATVEKRLFQSGREQSIVSDPSRLGTAYLIIGTFPKLQNSAKFRVVPELCYCRPEPLPPERESLIEDDCSVSIQDFPTFLQTLIQFAEKKLSRRYGDRPWRLRICLSLPMTILGSPLSQWCTRDLTHQYAIVVGCSERANPDCPRYAYLHNQLKLGWQRFFQQQQRLREINWVIADDGCYDDLELYEGLQCRGNWLKPSQSCGERWRKLVESGIPLALWLWDEAVERQQITQTFERLIDCYHQEFFEKIRRERRRNSCIPFGVFYDDPTYMPTVPETSQEQFFSWG